MDETAPSSSSSRKRPFIEDDSSIKPPVKKIRFPKGKKVKDSTTPLQDLVNDDVDVAKPQPLDLSDPRVAAKERARRRGGLPTQLADEVDEVAISHISVAEVRYQEDESFVNDGIELEPFNLEKEREEGYFDESGNFVEYVVDKEGKDAWLDSVEVVDPKLAKKLSSVTKNNDDEKETSSDDIGKMKRRIADALEPGETVLQALKRLKGHSTNKRAKMSAETKLVFDQLTEDAMRLMENGDYNVYQDKKEVFEREAEGYEALARVRNGEESFDMFADEADDVVVKSEDKNGTSMTGEGTSSQPAVEKEGQDSRGSWTEQSDYVYDESSGYYYSNSLGYYYDASTGLYCSASSGIWYKYNEETGTYDEVQPEPDTKSNAS